MEELPLSRAFTLIEPGPVILLTTHDGQADNIMTLTWSMVLDFSPTFAIATGPWNHSYAALRDTGECVLSIPSASMIDTAVGIGTCSGENTDKFEKFALTRAKARHVQAPLIRECIGQVECRVADITGRHNIIVLEGLAAWTGGTHADQRMIHAVGDGTFIADGERFDRKDMMRSKLPGGL
ncbi:flavin reductase family protein [Novosphingobium beihaiensis]|uniref:Flavin reductase family protein n=1 Tax=Novosphingobium beihaiensis TaxID=2930389 RepID=A0ABT0BS92_9SPHN|nr:flavin reductase family protein [Novosphingobium beihaiensis]MCJ2187909.1 flavin reductase family protein [Novosphingobium beihaiensis]